MLETVNIGRWTLEVDREATESAFAKIPLGSPESCECNYCKNLVVARDQAYPPEAKQMLAKLGIDYRKEAETWEWTRLDDGRHSYGGFFHFVGNLREGAEAMQYDGNVGTFHLERVGDYFEYGFRRDAELVEEPFNDQPIVQLEFTTVVPWLIDAPDPEESFVKPDTFLTKMRKFFTKPPESTSRTPATSSRRP